MQIKPVSAVLLSFFISIDSLRHSMNSLTNFPGKGTISYRRKQDLHMVVLNLEKENEFAELIGKPSVQGYLVVVDFSKGHCKPCQKTAPLFENLSEKYGASAVFAKVDADSSPEAKGVLKKQGIKSVPTFQLWLDGNKIDTIQGAHIDELEESIQSTVAKLNLQ